MNKAELVGIQLKRRLKYKSVYEEMFVNPAELREALFELKRLWPAFFYKDIQIEDMNEIFLSSHLKQESQETQQTSAQEPEEKENRKEGIIGMSDESDSESEMGEYEEDIRAKYNIGTVFNQQNSLRMSYMTKILSSLHQKKIISCLIEALKHRHFLIYFQMEKDLMMKNAKRPWTGENIVKLGSIFLRFSICTSRFKLHMFLTISVSDLKHAHGSAQTTFRKAFCYYSSNGKYLESHAISCTSIVT